MNFGVVIVNYNCARLSLSAALSALGDDASARIVIVDNGSTDDSITYLKSVFEGERSHQCEAPANAVPAPRFKNVSEVATALCSENSQSAGDAQLTVLTLQQNRGFAAGCNAGLRYLRTLHDPAHYLLLNPDAVLGAGALSGFAERLMDKSAGLCGASILRHELPHHAQAFGGARLNPMTLLGDNLAAGRPIEDAPSRDIVEAAMSYPLGAAMAFRKNYLDVVGYLDERFFLYYEEADWARRGAPKYQPVWAPSAVVYHRHGAVAGSRVQPGERSPQSDFHMARSRMLYALKWRPILLPVLWVGGVVQAIRRLLRGHWRQAGAVVAGSFLSAAKKTR